MACLVYVFKNNFLFSKIMRIRKIRKTCLILDFFVVQNTKITKKKKKKIKRIRIILKQ